MMPTAVSMKFLPTETAQKRGADINQTERCRKEAPLRRSRRKWISGRPYRNLPPAALYASVSIVDILLSKSRLYGRFLRAPDRRLLGGSIAGQSGLEAGPSSLCLFDRLSLMTRPASSETSSPPSSPPKGAPLTGAQQIVDTLHEPLLVLDHGLRVQQVNPAFYRTFEAIKEDTIGRSLFEIGGGHFDHPALRDPLQALRDEHEPFEKVELEGTFEGLGRRAYQVNGQVLPASGDASEQILLAINDVTQQRQLEERLRQRARELEQSNENLEQFAYAASHDLQEPLRMVSSYLQLLERRYKDELDETAQEFIGYAVDGAERMKALINGLLQYSRVGRKEKEFGEVDLDSVLDGILGDLERRIHELGATVEAGPLPTTYGSRDQLRRLLQNLIENALTYHGDEPPSIHVSGERAEEGAAHVAVRDEGPGIPEEGQQKVFQIFNQLDPHGEGREGSGMGLALCKKIAQRHRGNIWVESEPGEGSAFHFTLHLSPDDA